MKITLECEPNELKQTINQLKYHLIPKEEQVAIEVVTARPEIPANSDLIKKSDVIEKLTNNDIVEKVIKEINLLYGEDQEIPKAIVFKAKAIFYKVISTELEAVNAEEKK